MICILLSTYNGEHYLDEQIASLVDQQNVDFRIFVRDDGSIDSTHVILNKWQRLGYLTWYKGDNIGFAESFMDLVQNAPQADYYAFCDQDDIWLPNKLKAAIEKLKLLRSGPQLYCSNLYIYRNGINEGEWWKTKPVISLYRGLVQNVATGCTMVFNHALRKLVITHKPQNLNLHDFWFFHTALLFGNVCFDENAYILYRQHGLNQIGSKTRLIDKLQSRVRSIRRLSKQHYRENEALQLLECYQGMISNSNLEILENVAYFRYSLRRRLILLFSSKYVMNNWFDTLMLKIRIILGCL